MPSKEAVLLILKEYFGENRSKLRWIQKESDKSVWKVTLHHKQYVLKCRKKNGKHSILPILLQDEMSRKGLCVPSVVLSQNQKAYVENKTHLYFLSEYVQGSSASMKERVKAIAQYHKEAVLPRSLRSLRPKLIATPRIKDWIKEYELYLRRLKHWMKIYKLPKDMRHCIEMAEACLRLSKKSSLLKEHIKRVNRRNLLTHGDFYSSNVIRSKKGKVWIIDLDRSKIDSPVKDLRPLMPNMVLSSYYDKYFSKYPQGRRYEQIYYMDALFPHRLYKCLRGFVRQKEKLKDNSTVIKQIIAQEIKKEHILRKSGLLPTKVK